MSDLKGHEADLQHLLHERGQKKFKFSDQFAAAWIKSYTYQACKLFPIIRFLESEILPNDPTPLVWASPPHEKFLAFFTSDS